jgi:NitT/TauT family transport system substrate-binding protein
MRFATLLTLLLVGAQGCLGLRGAEPRPLTPVVFQLDWHPNVQFAGLFLAKERGWYREAGLDVTLLPVDPEMRVIDRVLGGTNWLGCTESGVFLAARAGGARIKAIGTMFQGSPMALISLKEKGLTNLAALKGRRVGIHPDGQRALDLILAHDGIPREQLVVTEKEHDLTPLLAGNCDAVQGYLIDEAVELEMQGHAINVIPYHQHGYTAYSQVYYTSEDFLKRDPATLKKFLAVSRRGWQAAFLDPEGTSRMVVEKFAPHLDRQYQLRSLEKIAALSTFESGFGRLGTMNPKTWETASDIFQRMKVLDHRMAMGEMVNSSLVNPTASLPPGISLRKDFREAGGSYPDFPGAHRCKGAVIVHVAANGQPTIAVWYDTSGSPACDTGVPEFIRTQWHWPAGEARNFWISWPLKHRDP